MQRNSSTNMYPSSQYRSHSCRHKLVFLIANYILLLLTNQVMLYGSIKPKA